MDWFVNQYVIESGYHKVRNLRKYNFDIFSKMMVPKKIQTFQV